MKQIKFTNEGYKKLREELQSLVKKRPLAVIDLKKAREMGDLSENGYYKAARGKLSAMDRRLQYLRYYLKLGKIIETMSTDTVAIGTTVTVTNKNETVTYHIVGDLESNPSEQKISLQSPIGKALEGKKVGEIVEITVPLGKRIYTISRIA